MKILLADLKEATIKTIQWQGEEGLGGAISLHKEYGDDSIVFGAIPSFCSESVVNTWALVWHSAISNKMEFENYNSPHGYSLYKLGFSALVIVGRADKLKYISLLGGNIGIYPIENMRESKSKDFENVFTSLNEVALSTGPASDKGVLFGALQYKGRNLRGLGLGNSFYSHNLKGIIMPFFPHSIKNEESGNTKTRENNKFMKMLKTYGSYCLVPYSLSSGWMPIRYYSDRFDPRGYSFDGFSMAEKYGNYPDSCSNCHLACLRRTKDGRGLPDWRDMFFLGPNLGFFDPENIIELYNRCIDEGLEVPTTASILSYLLAQSDEKRESYDLRGKKIEDLLSFISKIATGSVLPGGLAMLEDAIQCYDHRPILYDLRGSFGQALLCSLGLDMFLPATLIFSRKPLKVDVISLLTLYSIVYNLALLSLGHPSYYASILYWSNVPSFAFNSVFSARLFAKRFNAFGYKSDELLVKGFEIFNSLNLSWHDIPLHFLMDSNSDLDSTTVPLKRLQDSFDYEKYRLSITVRSIKERMEKEKGVSRAKLGGVEERGSEIEPGLK